MRLKILIHGQEVETLAGHLDLTGSFTVNPKAAQAAVEFAPGVPVSSNESSPPLTLTSVSRQTYAASSEQRSTSRNP